MREPEKSTWAGWVVGRPDQPGASCRLQTFAATAQEWPGYHWASCRLLILVSGAAVALFCSAAGQSYVLALHAAWIVMRPGSAGRRTRRHRTEICARRYR